MPENALKGLQPPRAGMDSRDVAAHVGAPTGFHSRRVTRPVASRDRSGSRSKQMGPVNGFNWGDLLSNPQNLEFTLWLEGLAVPRRTQMVRFYTININQSTYRNILVTI